MCWVKIRQCLCNFSYKQMCLIISATNSCQLFSHKIETGILSPSSYNEKALENFHSQMKQEE